MGLESVSASKDVIGDLPSPWPTIEEAIQDEGEGEGGYTAESGITTHDGTRVFTKRAKYY